MMEEYHLKVVLIPEWFRTQHTPNTYVEHRCSNELRSLFSTYARLFLCLFFCLDLHTPIHLYLSVYGLDEWSSIPERVLLVLFLYG